MRCYRLFSERYRQSAFSGVGGLYAARRWNLLGVEMVYTATSRALAALEYFVNLDPCDAPEDLQMAEAEVPEELIVRMDLTQLPGNWRELENPECSRLGSEWVRQGQSAALLVPSVVVDGDWNLLLNPRHTDFPRVKILDYRDFHFDERMFHRPG